MSTGIESEDGQERPSVQLPRLDAFDTMGMKPPIAREVDFED
jgi:hypothetical protein